MMKVCVATRQHALSSALISTLRAQGNAVDLIHVLDLDEKWVDRRCPSPGVNLLLLESQSCSCQERSHLCMQHILREQYPLVFFDELDGLGYYTLLARHTGNENLRKTKVCVLAYGSAANAESAGAGVWDGLRCREMSRRSIELADAILTPTASTLQQYRDLGWNLPDSQIVSLLLLLTKLPVIAASQCSEIDEIVFMGELEPSRGLLMFCQALERLQRELISTVVTFFGATTTREGTLSCINLLRLSAAWPFKTQLLTNRDRSQVLSYLKAGRRLSVIPEGENSAALIAECLKHTIPFIAPKGSGAEELIDVQSRKGTLFQWSVEGISTKLLEALQKGCASARSGVDIDAAKKAFSDCINRLLATASERMTEPPGSSVLPVLLVLAEPEHGVEKTAAALEKAIHAYEGNVEIHALTSDTARLRTRLSAESTSIKVGNFEDFEAIARSLSLRQPTVLGLCHITQMLAPIWTGRAAKCFELNPNIAAITGMVGVELEPAPDELEKIARYLMGNAEALFPLALETNGGFVLMRSELIGSISQVSPLDAQYGRLKAVEEWVHELLVTLHLKGERFELVPDLAAHELRQVPFEIFRVGGLMRSLAQRRYARGSDQAWLARLAVDMGLAEEQGRANEQLLDRISNNVGEKSIARFNCLSRSQQLKMLALIATEGGQAELAKNLARAAAETRASSLAQENVKPRAR